MVQLSMNKYKTRLYKDQLVIVTVIALWDRGNVRLIEDHSCVTWSTGEESLRFRTVLFVNATVPYG